MGQGFHECLQRDYPDWWVSHESETVAETIRFFVELRMNTGTTKRWLPRAKHSKVIETCDYSLGGPTGFTNLLRNRLSIEQVEQLKVRLNKHKLSPELRATELAREKDHIQAIRLQLGRRVVVVYKKGGRIEEERRFDSASDSYKEVSAVELSIGLAIMDTPIGSKLIGKGFIGLLPWEADRFGEGQGFTESERLSFSCSIRIVDVVEDENTEVTTIYLESSPANS